MTRKSIRLIQKFHCLAIAGRHLSRSESSICGRVRQTRDLRVCGGGDGVGLLCTGKIRQRIPWKLRKTRKSSKCSLPLQCQQRVRSADGRPCRRAVGVDEKKRVQSLDLRLLQGAVLALLLILLRLRFDSPHFLPCLLLSLRAANGTPFLTFGVSFVFADVDVIGSAQ